ncbi:hypothetical protein GCM10027416_31190 [Okibacterium endophyticum]
MRSDDLRQQRVYALARGVAGLGIVAAVVGQLMVSISHWQSRGDERIDIDVVNFFSFFTIQSNVIAAVMLAFGAVVLIRHSEPVWFPVFRASVTTYMVTTGIVYNLLLRGIELPQGSTLAWSNEVLHLVAPLYVLLDWLFAPGRRPVQWRSLGWIVVYPIVWVGYTLVRGPLTLDQLSGEAYWYPYPFLNPNLPGGGYTSVAFYVAAIAATIVVVAAVLIWTSRRRVFEKREAPSSEGVDVQRGAGARSRSRRSLK